jgi:transcriptional regulator with XRE-family HTH domain
MAASNPQLVALGAAIRHARQLRGLTQEQAAALAGLHPTQYGGIERGRRRAPVTTVLSISDAFGMRSAELFGLYDRISAGEALTLS